MRLGINWVPEHASPEDWVEQLVEMECRATVFPVNHTTPVALIDRYVQAAAERDICIAEVGVWNSLMTQDATLAAENYAYAKGQLELAEYVGARCCVNVSGATGSCWYMLYKENYAPETFERNVLVLQKLLDAVRPRHTYYALEMMPWMLPDSPEQYLAFLQAIDRERLAVHVDVANLIRDIDTYLNHNVRIDKTFSLLGGRIRSCHLKDVVMAQGVTVCFQEVTLGEGDIDLAHYGRRVNEEDADMPLLVEHLQTKTQYADALRYVGALYRKEGIAL